MMTLKLDKFLTRPNITYHVVIVLIESSGMQYQFASQMVSKHFIDIDDELHRTTLGALCNSNEERFQMYWFCYKWLLKFDELMKSTNCIAALSQLEFC